MYGKMRNDIDFFEEVLLSAILMQGICFVVVINGHDTSVGINRFEYSFGYLSVVIYKFILQIRKHR